jgi:hypothetical protein
MDLIGPRGSPKFPKRERQGMTCLANQVEALCFLHTDAVNKEKSQRETGKKKGEGRSFVVKERRTHVYSPSKFSLKLPSKKNQNYNIFFRRGKGRSFQKALYLFLSQKYMCLL